VASLNGFEEAPRVAGAPGLVRQAGLGKLRELVRGIYPMESGAAEPRGLQAVCKQQASAAMSPCSA